MAEKCVSSSSDSSDSDSENELSEIMHAIEELEIELKRIRCSFAKHWLPSPLVVACGISFLVKKSQTSSDNVLLNNS